MRIAPEVVLSNDEQAELTALVRSQLTSVRLSLRARIVLLPAKGMQNKDIAVQLGVGRLLVALLRGKREIQPTYMQPKIC
jgi:DNA-binding NarL/FixJ family response regulator